MRKLLVVAVPAGLAILAAALVLSSFRSRADAEASRLERARLKREFAERAAVLRALPPDRPAEWQGEVVALTRWYQDELQAIRNRYPEVSPAPGALAAAEEDRKGKIGEKERAAIADFQKYADGRAKLLREGAYGAVGSAEAAGLRLDLVSVESGAGPEGTPGLRVDFALWGAPRYLERERSGDKTVTRTVTPVAFKKLAVQFLDAKGKPYGEMSGAGEPYQKLADPERFVEDFPPGVLFGTWWLELLPREAATAQVSLEVDVRGASGAVRPATFALSLPVPEGWKIPPGATYQAEVREAAPPRP
ncbi:hypothetical protein [Anaeromyxobacter oryzae]|uniref:Uncharacterized protein n=1 Tax=Anaeromyxobacter oryzae TaxID=2918170 RepID=A0ABN6N047_9BACT|nr:hypothetical protein [Anaeromyxobacter oryzae]BDG06575.1 hypothetical protein AMOR_55710 [Anaeromyxobacter oryzae]